MIIDLRRKKLYILLALIIFMITILSSDFYWRLFYPLPYRDLIRQYSQENNIDPFLVAAIIKTESKFDPMVQSKRGAIGLMQVMPETGQWIAEQIKLEGFESKDLFDGETSIRLGTWYVANLLKQFEQEIVAISAYNAGRGNVKRWLDDGVWDGTAENLDNVPFNETKSYVKKVVNYRKTYKDIYNDKF